MNRLITFLLFFIITVNFISCSKKDEYKLRPAKPSEIGIQAICPVTNNVFNVSTETKAVDYKGKTYFLCCPDCSADFKKKLGIAQEHKHDVQSSLPSSSVDKNVIYWTCPMHPQVKEIGSGKCPICSMDLVPVYKKSGNRIGVDPAKGNLLGLKSEEAKVMRINKTIRLPARVAYDNDLYLAQQEYILTSKNFADKQSDILEAAKFRLTLLGYTDNDIKELEKQDKPDKTLLYPGDKAWMFADVYYDDFQVVTAGRNITAVVDTYPSTKFNGKVMFVEPALNPETRSAKARILVDNTKNLLKIEMFANIEIKSFKDSVLAVPKTAVLSTGLRKIVYKDYGNGEYEPVEVKTSFSGDDYVEIKDGLKSGDLVVTNGNFMLDSESQLRGSSGKNSMDNMPGMEGMDMGGKK